MSKFRVFLKSKFRVRKTSHETACPSRATNRLKPDTNGSIFPPTTQAKVKFPILRKALPVKFPPLLAQKIVKCPKFARGVLKFRFERQVSAQDNLWQSFDVIMHEYFYKIF